MVNLNAQAAKKVDLNNDWTVSNQEFSFQAYKVSIPNTIHTVLHDERRIDDPLFQYNDLKLRYLSNSNYWVFTKQFKLNKDEVKNYFS